MKNETRCWSWAGLACAMSKVARLVAKLTAQVASCSACNSTCGLQLIHAAMTGLKLLVQRRNINPKEGIGLVSVSYLHENRASARSAGTDCCVVVH